MLHFLRCINQEKIEASKVGIEGDAQKVRANLKRKKHPASRFEFNQTVLAFQIQQRRRETPVCSITFVRSLGGYWHIDSAYLLSMAFFIVLFFSR